MCFHMVFGSADAGGERKPCENTGFLMARGCAGGFGGAKTLCFHMVFGHPDAGGERKPFENHLKTKVF